VGQQLPAQREPADELDVGGAGGRPAQRVRVGARVGAQRRDGRRGGAAVGRDGAPADGAAPAHGHDPALAGPGGPRGRGQDRAPGASAAHRQPPQGHRGRQRDLPPQAPQTHRQVSQTSQNFCRICGVRFFQCFCISLLSWARAWFPKKFHKFSKPIAELFDTCLRNRSDICPTLQTEVRVFFGLQTSAWFCGHQRFLFALIMHTLMPMTVKLRVSTPESR
jgi:hypothetical protein